MKKLGIVSSLAILTLLFSFDLFAVGKPYSKRFGENGICSGKEATQGAFGEVYFKTAVLYDPQFRRHVKVYSGGPEKGTLFCQLCGFATSTYFSEKRSYKSEIAIIHQEIKNSSSQSTFKTFPNLDETLLYLKDIVCTNGEFEKKSADQFNFSADTFRYDSKGNITYILNPKVAFVTHPDLKYSLDDTSDLNAICKKYDLEKYDKYQAVQSTISYGLIYDGSFLVPQNFFDPEKPSSTIQTLPCVGKMNSP